MICQLFFLFLLLKYVFAEAKMIKEAVFLLSTPSHTHTKKVSPTIVIHTCLGINAVCVLCNMLYYLLCLLVLESSTDHPIELLQVGNHLLPLLERVGRDCRIQTSQVVELRLKKNKRNKTIKHNFNHNGQMFSSAFKRR